MQYLMLLVYGAILTAILTNGNMIQIMEEAERAVWRRYIQEMTDHEDALARWGDDGGYQAQV
jgi:hypothetical protein